MPRSCDACHAASALVYCRPDAAYLCLGCDVKVHGANKLASRHERVWMCEVCEQSPAVVTCKADAAALCLTCDTDIHAANPLASRHERFPIMPFYECVGLSAVDASGTLFKQEQCATVGARDEDEDNEFSVAEAESWILPSDGSCKNGFESLDVDTVEAVATINANEKPKAKDTENAGLFPDDDLFPDLQSASVMGYTKVMVGDSIASHHDVYFGPKFVHPVVVDAFHANVSPNAARNFPDPSLSTSISSTTHDFGVVPDSTFGEVSTASAAVHSAALVQNAVQLEPMEREARVRRYRERRKNRKFEKTIRYASRKAYAEIRPRVKGRFVKRTAAEGMSQIFPLISDTVYGVVPSL